MLENPLGPTTDPLTWKCRFDPPTLNSRNFAPIGPIFKIFGCFEIFEHKCIIYILWYKDLRRQFHPKKRSQKLLVKPLVKPGEADLSSFTRLAKLQGQDLRDVFLFFSSPWWRKLQIVVKLNRTCQDGSNDTP